MDKWVSHKIFSTDAVSCPFVAQKLKNSLEFRKTKYIDLQERITYRTKVYFTHFLNQRDYSGGMTFNHDKERLEIEVKVDRHTDQSRSTKNTKALSGGERSFATVCFIVSLWDAMEAPFRCLDEFDVFMVSFEFVFRPVQQLSITINVTPKWMSGDVRQCRPNWESLSAQRFKDLLPNCSDQCGQGF